MGEQSCRAAPALTGPGVCYSWPCPVLKITPALRKGAVSPVWVCSVPVGLKGGKVVHFPSSTAVPQPGILGQDPPVPAAGAPYTPAEWAVLLGHGRGSVSVLAHRAGWVRAGSGLGLGPCAPGVGAVVAPPHWHRRASLGAPSSMRRSLLCDRRLLMLNALIRRDKTTLKIPRCQPPVGPGGLPGGRRSCQGAAGKFPNSSSSKWL